jgi:electron transport complex protein RnfG
MRQHILNLGLRLFLVCLVAAIALGFTYSAVEKKIAAQEIKQRSDAAQTVFRPIDAEPQEDPELTASLQGAFPDLIDVFKGVDSSGDVIGYAFVLKSKGYNFITMAVGVDSNGKVTGIKVVTNEETPGLGGTAAEDPTFLGQFNGKGPDPLVLKKDVDAYTSATYTSRGITNGVNMALDMWNNIQQSG